MAKQEDIKAVKVDKYPERPYAEAKANPKDIEKVENLPEKDQIEDYHKKHPTLKRTAQHKADPPSTEA